MLSCIEFERIDFYLVLLEQFTAISTQHTVFYDFVRVREFLYLHVCNSVYKAISIVGIYAKRSYFRSALKYLYY